MSDNELENYVGQLALEHLLDDDGDVVRVEKLRAERRLQQAVAGFYAREALLEGPMPNSAYEEIIREEGLSPDEIEEIWRRITWHETRT
jgi:hypothetical protein